ncbi:MAG: SUMF1/EgtB/PvdO family nonheme iron enzyme [Proteobacteria bacterium]|nr:SUMF1/EgtB/PvdO family nonheme iron enzyme [Pseudomonadota bacterium]
MESGNFRRLTSWLPCATIGMTAAFIALLPAFAVEPEAFIPDLVEIPSGSFIQGSDRAEREAAYLLDEAAYGHARTREGGWYEDEPPRTITSLPGFAITRTPITNAQYAAFIAATGRPAPNVEPAVWVGYGLIHPFERTRRHAWRDGAFPAARGDHPVVLVSHADARAYAAWLSSVTGESWRLPTEAEWEKAVRGSDGRRFPWGDTFDPARLNSHDSGPFDTLPVGVFPAGAGPWGVLNGAGQVYEWTDTPAGPSRYIVKGGSWDDSGCGVCRPAARHARPADLKHILIGIRLLREAG